VARKGRAFWGGLLTKFAALVAACAIWIYVDSVVMKTRTIEVRATITREDGREIAGLAGTAPVVRITVRGPADEVEHLTDTNVSCAGVVPDEYAGGPVTVRFAREEVTFPSARGVRVLAVSPTTARLEASPASF